MSEPVFVYERIFKAPRALVFDCFAKVEHMSKWFRSPGSVCEFIYSDVRPGGYNHVKMVNPDMGTFYGKYTFREVTPIDRLVYVNAFADAEGNLVHHPMAPTWPLELLTELTFTDEGADTKLTLVWTAIDANEEELATFEAGLDGCRQGWGTTLDYLDTYLDETRG